MKYLITFFLLLSNLSFAMDFQYNNKNIDPNCVLQSNVEIEIDLKKCSEHLNKKVTRNNSKADFVGYQYIEDGVPGSLYYKYLGKINDNYVIHAGAIGGAVSRLDFINYFKIKKGKLILIKRGPSGDRANGGISNSRIQNNKILYELTNTPLLFMINFNYLEKGDNLMIENLADCAACQFAKVYYLNDKVTSVVLNEEVSTNNECLDRLHAEYKQTNKLKLTLKQAEQFAKSFLTKCKQ